MSRLHALAEEAVLHMIASADLGRRRKRPESRPDTTEAIEASMIDWKSSRLPREYRIELFLDTKFGS